LNIIKRILKIGDKNMVQVCLPTPGGSYFCNDCYLEYGKEGLCDCGGEIKFMSMHSNRYLSVWMRSRRAFEAKKEKDDNAKKEMRLQKL